MKSARGFTLIEVLVAGVISTILAGTVLSIMHMANTHTRKGIHLAMASQMHEAVFDYVYRTARGAAKVKTLGEQAGPPANLDATMNQSGVVFADRNNAPVGGIKYLSGSHKLQYLAAPYGPGDWRYFVVAGDTARIKLYENGPFNIYANRRGVEWVFGLIRSGSGLSDTIPPAIESSVCRNY